MPYDDELGPRTIQEAFSMMVVEELKHLAALLGKAPTRKGDLVDMLASAMEDPEQVRRLYAGLDDVGQKSIQEATHDAFGVLDISKFQSKYGNCPNFGSGGSSYRDKSKPTTLRLFFPRKKVLAQDLQKILEAFVPEPPPLTVNASDDLPPKVRRPHVNLGSYSRKPDEKEVEPLIRQTDRAALHDVKAVLRLIDAGEVRVGDKSRRPSQAAMKAITGVLAEGDFYTEADQSKDDWDP